MNDNTIKQIFLALIGSITLIWLGYIYGPQEPKAIEITRRVTCKDIRRNKMLRKLYPKGFEFCIDEDAGEKK